MTFGVVYAPIISSHRIFSSIEHATHRQKCRPWIEGESDWLRVSFFSSSFSFGPALFIMPATFPKDRSACMRPEGPADPWYRILQGELLYNAECDARFPYIYCIPTHPLVHSLELMKQILIHIVDTSLEAWIDRVWWHKTLTVPLSPDKLMEKYGTSFFSSHLQCL